MPPKITGLYTGSARFLKDQPKPQELVARSYREIAVTSSLVDTMASMDKHLSRLKQAQKAGWTVPAGFPAMAPKQEATLLWEQLSRRLSRTDHLAGRPEDFRQKLTAAEQAANKLRTLLAANPADKPKLDAAFEQSAQSCAACHKRFRNP